MSIILQAWVGCLLWLLLSPAHALSGVQTALQLNARFNATPAQCVGRSPEFACSGVLAGPVTQSDGQRFWRADDSASTTRRLLFLRKDRADLPLAGGAGFLVFDRLTATGLGKSYQAAVSATLPSEVVVTSWNDQAPGALPVQAVYYDTRAPRSLLLAQRSQRDYFQATGLWLPVVRLQVGEPEGRVFGFAQEDQLNEGYRVSQRLNGRYRDSTMQCRRGRTPFDCSGVFIRTVGVGAFDFWNPSPQSNAIQYVSFSYLRRDTAVSLAVSPQGYVVRELAAPAVSPLEVGCSYPVDAGTHGAQSGNKNACTFSGVCSQMGIDSVTAWSNRYRGVLWTSCAMGTDAKALALMNDIRRQVPGVVGWNEVMFKVWPQNLGSTLPIEAVFYSTTTFFTGDGRPGSRAFQRQYLDKTNRQLPLLKLNAQAPDGQVFSYDPQDQNL